MGKKQKQEEMLQKQHNDYTKPEEFKILTSCCLIIRTRSLEAGALP